MTQCEKLLKRTQCACVGMWGNEAYIPPPSAPSDGDSAGPQSGDISLHGGCISTGKLDRTWVYSFEKNLPS